MPLLDFLRSTTVRLASAATLRLKALEDIRGSLGWVIAVKSALRSAVADVKTQMRRTRCHAPAVQHVAVPPATGRLLNDGILFIGYVEANLGLGQSIRGLIKAAEICRPAFRHFAL